MVDFTLQDSHHHAKKLINRGKNAWGKFLIALLVLPFTLCVDILIVLAKLFKMSYKQVAVVLNLYIQGGILMLSALIPAVSYCIYMYHSITFTHIVVFFLWVLYFVIYLVYYVALLKRYPAPLNKAFDSYTTDLEIISNKFHMPYMFINLFIFVIIWLGVIALNCILGHVILTSCGVIG